MGNSHQKGVWTLPRGKNPANESIKEIPPEEIKVKAACKKVKVTKKAKAVNLKITRVIELHDAYTYLMLSAYHNIKRLILWDYTFGRDLNILKASCNLI